MSTRAALDAYLAAAGQFDWLRNNCCHFVSGWILQRTGRDCMIGLRPTAGPIAAQRVKRSLGGTLAAAMDRLYQPSIPPQLSRTGDVVRVAPGALDLLGLCADGKVICLAGLAGGAGLAVLPLDAATHAWRVP